MVVTGSKARNLDEALYPIPGLINYRAEVTEKEGRAFLAMTLHLRHNAEQCCATQVSVHALRHSSSCALLSRQGTSVFGEILLTSESQPSSGVAKKTIHDLRNGGTRQ